MSRRVDDRTVYFVEVGTSWEITNISRIMQNIDKLYLNSYQINQNIPNKIFKNMFAKAKYSQQM